MTVANADYASTLEALRRSLGKGHLTGEEVRTAIDVIEHAVNTLDNNVAVDTVNTDADALEALLVTHFAILVADGATPTQAHVDAMVAACATPRTTLIASVNAAVAAGGTAITNITADDVLDGRAV